MVSVAWTVSEVVEVGLTLVRVIPVPILTVMPLVNPVPVSVKLRAVLDTKTEPGVTVDKVNAATGGAVTVSVAVFEL